MPTSPTVLVMAAGEGTRMRSSLPKVMHPLCGRPLVAWPVLAAREAGAGRVAVIASPGHDLSAALPAGTETIIQPEANGTGGAVLAAIDVIRESETVVVLSGDSPLVTAEVIARLLGAHEEAGAAATVMTAEMDEPGSYGRIVRDEAGDIARIVEAKDSAGDASGEELAIREVNTGTYVFAAGPLAEDLGRISNDNAQGEYYLGDVLPLMREAGLRVAAHLEREPGVNLGVNTRADLALVGGYARRAINDRHMLAGVTITDPEATWIDADVEIGVDATIEPGSYLRGATRVASGAVVGPHSTISDTTVGEGASVIRSHLLECDVDAGCNVGPFAYLRPGATLRDGAKVGAFVEVKNSEIGAGSKVPHLSYVGDADVGAGSNLGAGTVTANYDGFRKNRTRIGDRVRIGVDTMLVAPVSVGDDAYTGAGAVIREDVPPGALGVSENAQRNVEGFAERKAQEAEKEDDEKS
ncbi:MAG TPA: bifunctional UDP-N-acetylglucosamine diphosphorylase/glucosamine-1-phosphate N-acetyltransferase GlmU [Solirubrobacterales bacterium]